MKNFTPCPSKNQILNWLNSYVQKDLGRLRRIQELGNCSAFLYMIAQIKPGMIKLDKVFKNPVAGHQIAQNIKILMHVLEKLNLDFKFEFDKLASMKYQQSYHLATFMYQNFRNAQNQQQNNNSRSSNMLKPRQSVENQKEIKKIYKVTIPVKPKAMLLTNDAKDDDSCQNIHEILKGPITSSRKYEEIQGIFQESNASDQQKLSKIAKILNINYVKAESAHERLKKALSITPSQKLSIQASYKSYIRPSLSRNSKFLNDQLDQQDQPNKITVRVTQQGEREEAEIDKENTRKKENYQARYEDDLLYSHKNDTNMGPNGANLVYSHRNEANIETTGANLVYSHKNEANMDTNQGNLGEMSFNRVNPCQNISISQEQAYPMI